ncbi:serine/threonine protein kinase [Halorhabdus utahensis DSM 12940]|uniref:Serine/threonine protein kinase n=1 Tax=Halorhabdus utahensis (strain DSM 12940 / JCM 11049 / AX-2) TaxID=519442 RepID=C7NTM8_HALUD|nr:serine/threonine protein kinase [Halorhabdus utahensis]ACV12218.1 serine/threonine protein kinase [Halorhabdus utahensis DSM 12940]
MSPRAGNNQTVDVLLSDIRNNTAAKDGIDASTDLLDFAQSNPQTIVKNAGPILSLIDDGDFETSSGIIWSNVLDALYVGIEQEGPSGIPARRLVRVCCHSLNGPHDEKLLDILGTILEQADHESEVRDQTIATLEDCLDIEYSLDGSTGDYVCKLFRMTDSSIQSFAGTNSRDDVYNIAVSIMVVGKLSSQSVTRRIEPASSSPDTVPGIAGILEVVSGDEIDQEATADIRADLEAEFVEHISGNQILEEIFGSGETQQSQTKIEAQTGGMTESTSDSQTERSSTHLSDDHFTGGSPSNIPDRLSNEIDPIQEISNTVSERGVVWHYTATLASTRTSADHRHMVSTLNPEYVDDDDLIEAFSEGATRWAGISQNPQISTVFDWDETPRPWIIYEGGTSGLEDHIDDLPEADKIQVLTSIFEGLYTGSLYNIPHASLSPDTIVLNDVNQSLEPLLTDWGLTPQIRNLTESEFISQYTAPEQLNGNMSETTVVYRAGMLAFRILTGRHPFENTNNLRAKIRNSEIPDPSAVAAVPNSLDPVIRTAVAADPTERYQSVSDLRRNIIGTY